MAQSDPVLARNKRDDDRYKSSKNADRASGSWNSASTSWGDARYMKELGKEGIKRQQERMRSAADAEDYRQSNRKKARSKKRTSKSRSRSRGR
jgi:hypothetical protein